MFSNKKEKIMQLTGIHEYTSVIQLSLLIVTTEQQRNKKCKTETSTKSSEQYWPNSKSFY